MSACTGCQMAASYAENSLYPVRCPDCNESHQPPAIGGPDDEQMRVSMLQEQLNTSRDAREYLAKALERKLAVIGALEEQTSQLRCELHNANAERAKAQEAHQASLNEVDELKRRLATLGEWP